MKNLLLVVLSLLLTLLMIGCMNHDIQLSPVDVMKIDMQLGGY